MKFIQKKRTRVIILITLSLLINLLQFIAFKNYKQSQHDDADISFSLGLQIACIGINAIREKKTDELASIAILASGTSKASTSYYSTSYYKSNPQLMDTLWILNSNITNKDNIRDVLDKNDITILIPAIQKVLSNPLDETATKELDYLVRKHTVIGSALE